MPRASVFLKGKQPGAGKLKRAMRVMWECSHC